MGRSLWSESPLEKDFFRLLEFDADVASFQPQPLQIHYTQGGERRIYTPDVLVTYRDGSKTVFEVKPDEVAAAAEFQLLFRVARSICADSGFGFRLALESEVRLQPRLRNIKRLSHYARVGVGLREEMCCKKLFLSACDVSVREAKAHFERHGIDGSRFLALIYHGFLRIDLHQSLTPDARVWRT